MESKKTTRKPRVKKTPLPSPTPTATSIDKGEEYKNWVLENRAEFFNYNKKSRELNRKVFEIFNFIYNENKTPGGCGSCNARVWELVKKYYEL